MTIQKAAQNYSVKNKTCGVTTEEVKRTFGLKELYEWRHIVQGDVIRLIGILNEGLETDNIIKARFLQEVLLYQINDRIEFLQDFYQDLYDWIEKYNPEEFNKIKSYYISEE